MTVSADWELLHASMKATLSGLDRTSLTYDKLAGTAMLPAFEDDAAPGDTRDSSSMPGMARRISARTALISMPPSVSISSI